MKKMVFYMIYPIWFTIVTLFFPLTGIVIFIYWIDEIDKTFLQCIKQYYTWDWVELK